MRLTKWGLGWSLVAVVCSMTFEGLAQQSVSLRGAAASTISGAVPGLINYNSVLKDANGKPISEVTGVTFLLYKEEQGGAPIWIETQNLTPDENGHYTVTLGATKLDQSLADSFVNSEAHWLGVQIVGQQEQARVLLVAVPYALKAGDAQTIGGLPPSAFVLAAQGASTTGSSAEPALVASSSSAAVSAAPIGGTGTPNYLPLWTDSADLGSSILFQSGSGSSARIGINITSPLFTLDVKGTELVRGLFELSTLQYATASKGFNSNPLNLESSAFNSSAGTYTLNHFQWQAEPVGNNTASPGATLNLLYGTDPALPAETGLKLSSKGLFTFAPGQTFPGTGKGTVTSVGLSAPTSDFTVSGSPVTTSGTLGLAWKVAPTSADTANAIVKRDSGGNFNAGSISVTTVNAQELFSFNSSGGEAILAVATGSSGQGVWGEADGTGFWNNAGPDGVHGVSHSSNGSGVAGVNDNASGTGVYANSPYFGLSANAGVFGVYAISPNVAVFGSGSAGIYGQDDADNSEGVYGVGDFSGSNAGFFVGDVFISGSLSKGGGSFKIDHPLDPANKYLYHSFVESPDMMDVYNGNLLLDGNGAALVSLPDWFETLNRDFRYQLTAIGTPGPNLYVAEEISGNHFKIAGGKPGAKVSWQVTGIRRDAWANAHRIPVEQDKPDRERGFYLHPELYGAPPEKRIDWARHPKMMKDMKEQRNKRAAAAQSASPTP
jgi:trimeric autotransporter adhesin